MGRLILFALIVATSTAFAQKKTVTPAVYYPDPGNWTVKKPEDVGMSTDKINEAVEFHKQKESKTPKNLEQAHYQTFAREPFGEGIGPFAERGPATGLIIKN